MRFVLSRFNNGQQGYKNYNEVNIKQLKDLINKGYSMKYISKLLNIGIDKLRRIMVKNNIVKPKKVDLILDEKFIEYYNKNLSIEEICSLLNISVNLYNQCKYKFNLINKKKNYFLLNKEIILLDRKQKRKEWYIKNKDILWKKNRKYYKHKYYNDAEYRIKEYIRNSIRYRIKHHKGIKKAKTEELLGCSIEQLKQHLEKQFQDGMSWLNHSIKGWHIDHIVPCASFDLTKLEEQKKCFHYTNMQPLWAVDNLKKRDK